MGSRTKEAILLGIKRAGLFPLARYYTRRGLRILCYHALSRADEHVFNPVVFMTPDKFRRRMEILRELKMPVIELDRAVSGDYPDNAVVITFDDGWDSTLMAAEILKEFDFPSTVYVTSYYVKKQTQIFNVAARYVLWKTGESTVNLSEWGMAGKSKDQKFLDELLAIGKTLPAADRQRLCTDLCAAASVKTDGLFRLLSESELRSLSGMRMDIQLHTHRHELSVDDPAWNQREIRENRLALADLTERPLCHFCYPSGVMSPSQYRVLSDEGIVTAATVERHLNFEGCHPFEMGRFTDSENMSEIEFEAELAGVTDLLRRPRLLLTARRGFRAQRS